MNAARRLDVLRTNGVAAARAAENRLDISVPHLDWDVGAVLAHLGGVFRRFEMCLRGQVAEWPNRDTINAPADGLIEWYRASLTQLVDALGSTPLEEDYVTWAGPRDGHWILRRLANETVVHRWDIEAASGSPDGIDADVAREIVDEFLTTIVVDRGLAGIDDSAAHDGATLHLHATDDEAGEWFVTVVDGGLAVDRRHDKGDVALRAPAADLALWINGRIPISRLEAFGESADIDWWSRAFRFD